MGVFHVFKDVHMVLNAQRTTNNLSWQIAQISLTRWSVFLFLDVSTVKLKIYYFADRPTRNNFPDCPYRKKSSCFRLTCNLVKLCRGKILLGLISFWVTHKVAHNGWIFQEMVLKNRKYKILKIAEVHYAKIH